MYFRNYRLPNGWVDHSLKRAVSEHSSTVNMLQGHSHFLSQPENIFIIFVITLSGNDLENMSLIDVSNHTDVC